MGRRLIEPDEGEKIINMYKQGMSNKEIGKALERNYGVINRFLKSKGFTPVERPKAEKKVNHEPITLHIEKPNSVFLMILNNRELPDLTPGRAMYGE